jgi:hypothetical protein
MNRGGAAALTLGVFGLVLIWKGITGDVMTYRMGGDIIPRWMYCVGGLAMLTFPVVWFLVRSDFGRALLGL